MVSITLNNALFSKISNVHIFRTMHRIAMIFSSKCKLQVTWQMLSTFGTVEYSTGPTRTHKESTNWASNLTPKLLGWKRLNWSWDKKLNFFKVQDINTPIQPRKKKHQTDVILALKTFQDHLRCPCDNSKFSIFALPKYTSREKSHRKVIWEGKIRNDAIISETPQVVLKRF